MRVEQGEVTGYKSVSKEWAVVWVSGWPLKGSRTGMAVIRFMQRETALEGLVIGPSSQVPD